MKDKKKKISKWFDEHVEDISIILATTGTALLAFGTGYLIGDKICSSKVGASIRKLHDDGYIKFFNPSTGAENSIAEHIELVSQSLKK